MQFTRQGCGVFPSHWAVPSGLACPTRNLGKVKLDIALVSEGLSMHVLVSLSEHPLTLGAGLTQEQAQVFIRYWF